MTLNAFFFLLEEHNKISELITVYRKVALLHVCDKRYQEFHSLMVSIPSTSSLDMYVGWGVHEA